MSMISKQVKKLRELSESVDEDKIGKYLGLSYEIAFDEAADTIEALSAKLAQANMERSEAHYGGGWVPCSERLPEIERTVMLSLRSLDICIGFRSNTEGYFYANTEGFVLYKNILAWRELPNPYTESEKQVE